MFTFVGTLKPFVLLQLAVLFVSMSAVVQADVTPVSHGFVQNYFVNESGEYLVYGANRPNDERRLYSGSVDLADLHPHDFSSVDSSFSTLRGLSTSRDRAVVFLKSSSDETSIYSVNIKAPYDIVRLDQSPISKTATISLSPDGNIVVIKSPLSDGSVKLYSVSIMGDDFTSLDSFVDFSSTVGSKIGAIAISPDSNFVVFNLTSRVGFQDRAFNLKVVPIKGGNPIEIGRQGIDNPGSYVADFKISPDSTFVSYIRRSDFVPDSFRVYDLGVGELHRLNTPAAPSIFGKFERIRYKISPTSNLLAFTVNQRLFTINVDGTGLRTLFNAEQNIGGIFDYMFTGDGEKILFRSDKGTPRDPVIFIVDLSRDALAVKLSRQGDVVQAYNIDSTNSYMAYLNRTWKELIVVDLLSGQSRRVNDRITDPRKTISRFRFSEDGRNIAFSTHTIIKRPRLMFNMTIEPGIFKADLLVNSVSTAGGSVNLVENLVVQQGEIDYINSLAESNGRLYFGFSTQVTGIRRLSSAPFSYTPPSPDDEFCFPLKAGSEGFSLICI